MGILKQTLIEKGIYEIEDRKIEISPIGPMALIYLKPLGKLMSVYDEYPKMEDIPKEKMMDFFDEKIISSLMELIDKTFENSEPKLDKDDIEYIKKVDFVDAAMFAMDLNVKFMKKGTSSGERFRNEAKQIAMKQDGNNQK